MHTVTIREAKARLNALVDAAERGEQVVLMRGSRLVAAIVPVSADDSGLSARLTDPQAERLWRQIEGGRAGLLEGFSRDVRVLAEAQRRARDPQGPRVRLGRNPRTPAGHYR